MAITMTKLTKPHELYMERAASIAAKLVTLNAKLDIHAKREDADQKNWGFNGDLAHVEQVLDELTSFMS